MVNLGYVVDVNEDHDERAETVRHAWDLAGAVLVVAARPDWEESQVRGHPRGDGIVTSKGTFQKFFGQDELRGWIGSLTGSEPVAAGPGIFYVFEIQQSHAGARPPLPSKETGHAATPSGGRSLGISSRAARATCRILGGPGQASRSK